MMSKALEALEVLELNTTSILNKEDQINECINIIEKELKAIDIIKKTWKISFYDEELMITIDNCYSIIFKSQEKYDLLKEVLKEE